LAGAARTLDDVHALIAFFEAHPKAQAKRQDF